MTNYQKILAVGAVVIVGVWGCSQSPSGSPEKIKALEAKVNRLEEDFRASTAARDQFRKKLAEVEQEQAQLKQDLEATTKDRDDLRTQLKARTAERDTISGQFEGFRKSLKDLIGQTEANLAKPASEPPANTVSNPKPNL